MEKEFVPYELALKLKELGFDEECFSYYDLNNKPNFFGSDNLMDTHCVQVNRPTYSQAFRWFREEHYLISSIYQLSVNVKTGLSSFEYMIDKLNNLGLSQFIEDFPYNTYEEAEIACLENLIELVESKSE
jgi:hypothetical protein